MTDWWEGGKPDAVAPYTGGKLPGVDADGNGVVYPADGLSAGASVVRAFPFAFDTPDLLTGAPLYTPTPGDILLDAWIEIDTAWDGTTPLGDVGPFTGGLGLFAALAFGPGVDMTQADLDAQNTGMSIGISGPSLSTLAALVSGANFLGTGSGDNPTDVVLRSWSNLAGPRVLPAKFVSDDPIKVCVSQDGTNTGDDPGSTVGSAVLFLVTATPVGA